MRVEVCVQGEGKDWKWGRMVVVVSTPAFKIWFGARREGGVWEGGSFVRTTSRRPFQQSRCPSNTDHFSLAPILMIAHRRRLLGFGGTRQWWAWRYSRSGMGPEFPVGTCHMATSVKKEPLTTSGERDNRWSTDLWPYHQSPPKYPGSENIPGNVLRLSRWGFQLGSEKICGCVFLNSKKKELEAILKSRVTLWCSFDGWRCEI